MQLVANCMDWAKHRRRKAAAKMHLRLDLHSFLPSFAIVDTAGQSMLWDGCESFSIPLGILNGDEAFHFIRLLFG
jgi:hypothetical protein